MNVASVQSDQGKYMDSMLGGFYDHLQRIVSVAQAKLNAYLQRKLSITHGVIDPTPANTRVMRNLDDVFVRFLDEAGYDSLIQAFVGEFNGQLPFLDQIISSLGENLKNPFPPVNFSVADQNILAGLQASTVTALEDSIAGAAAVAVRSAMLTVGGLSFEKLTTFLADRFLMSMSRAKSLAETSMMIFYRTATDLAFQDIEKDLPGQQQKYRYSGPEDAKTRVFCERELARTNREGLTREQIDQLDNGQLANCFISGGGYNCRHQWLLDVRNLEKRFLKAA